MQLEDEIQSPFANERHKARVNIIYTGNWVTDNHRESLKKFDISFQQFNLLRILRGQFPNPATIGLLKDRMLDKMSDASRLVERLRAKGLVERISSKVDRRSVETRITQEGLDLLARIDANEMDLNTITKNLSDEEIHTLNVLLDKIRG